MPSSPVSKIRVKGVYYDLACQFENIDSSIITSMQDTSTLMKACIDNNDNNLYVASHSNIIKIDGEQKTLTDKMSEVSNSIMRILTDSYDIPVKIHDEHSFVDLNGQIASSNPYYITNPIFLQQGYTLKIYTKCATTVSIISKTDINSSSFESLVAGRNNNAFEWYEYTATEDCYIALSYRVAYSDNKIQIVSNGIDKDIESLNEIINKTYRYGAALTSVADEFLDLNTYPINITYKITNTTVATNVANKPDGVTSFTVFTFAGGTNTRIQFLISEDKTLYYRIFWGSAWSSWNNIDNIKVIANDLQKIFNEVVGIEYIQKNYSNGYVQWSDSTIVSIDDSRFFYTAPIELKTGETITARMDCRTTMCAFAKHETIENVDSYTRLVRGVSSSAEIQEYTYTATEDIEVVISGWVGRLDRSIWYITKSGIITNIESRIDSIQKDCTVNLFSAFDNIVSVGDSLTYCAVYTSSSSYRQAYNPWPKQIAQISGITNSGIYADAGYTAKQIWNTYKDAFEVPQNKKSICTIYLGTNNYFSDTLDTDAPVADEANYSTAWADTQTGCMCKIIQTFKNLGCKILIILPHAGGTGSGPEGWTLNDTRAVIMKMITRFGCSYIDDKDIYVNATNAPRYHYYSSSSSGTNNLHYNDLGYAYFASCLIDRVGRMTDENMKCIIP